VKEKEKQWQKGMKRQWQVAVFLLLKWILGFLGFEVWNPFWFWIWFGEERVVLVAGEKSWLSVWFAPSRFSPRLK
jgi:hypothetical protein